MQNYRAARAVIPLTREARRLSVLHPKQNIQNELKRKLVLAWCQANLAVRQ